MTSISRAAAGPAMSCSRITGELRKPTALLTLAHAPVYNVYTI